MGFSHDVKLPKEVIPSWPDRCVSCGLESPNHSLRLRTSSITLLSTLTMSFGGTFKVAIPICRGCAPGARWRRIGNTVLSLALGIGGVFLARWLLSDYQGSLKTLAIIGIMLGCIVIPTLVVDLIWTPAIDLTAYKEKVDYEFRDRGFAEEFAAMNDGEVD